MGRLKGVEVVKLTFLNMCFFTLKEDGCTRKTVEPTVKFGGKEENKMSYKHCFTKSLGWQYVFGFIDNFKLKIKNKLFLNRNRKKGMYS